MSYTIRIKNLDKLVNAFRKSPQLVHRELSLAVKTSVNLIRPLMKRQAPYAKGKLRMNIYARAAGLRGEIGPNISITPYAIYVEEGTRPHEIRPRTKKALYWPGALHPVRLVMHPGTKANPFVKRTADEARMPVARIFQNATERIIKRLTI